MKTKGKFAKLTSLALLVATLTIYTANRAGAAGITPAPAVAAAQTDLPEAATFSFGGIGIGRGQTASIIVVCLGDPNARDQQPIELEFMFHDRDGNLLASERKTCLPGHAASFELGGIMPPPTEIQPCLIQPCIRVVGGPEAANLVVPTFEAFDSATRRTLFALNNPTKSTHGYFASSGEGVVRFGQSE